MAGNSQRKGAIRKTSKGPTAGSGGRVKRGLEGKGPTPKAVDRPYHKAHKAKNAAERQQARKPKRRTGSSDAEWVAGRNAVVELLRTGTPVSGVYVAEGAERDGRLGVAQSVRGRIRDLGGDCTVASAPGEGTSLEMVVPR